jgi:hypothetical protein
MRGGSALHSASTTSPSSSKAGDQQLVGGLIRYTIDALVADGDMVAVAWTGTLPSGAEMKGLSLYRATGGLLRSTRHALIGDMPA